VEDLQAENERLRAEVRRLQLENRTLRLRVNVLEAVLPKPARPRGIAASVSERRTGPSAGQPPGLARAMRRPAE
jgi:hypothetical protein